MDKQTLTELMLNDDSLRETILQFVEGSHSPRSLYADMEIILENLKARLNEPEALDHEKEAV